ncbi:MAG: hypothetical protein IJW15_02595, partial [Clostridia bacterium]|nr:hypothetical protein [Clostridia bacterium]
INPQNFSFEVLSLHASSLSILSQPEAFVNPFFELFLNSFELAPSSWHNSFILPQPFPIVKYFF